VKCGIGGAGKELLDEFDIGSSRNTITRGLLENRIKSYQISLKRSLLRNCIWSGLCVEQTEMYNFSTKRRHVISLIELNVRRFMSLGVRVAQLV
jgi:hypothetical protein